VFKDFLIFCGIGLTNAQLFEMSVNQYMQNQVDITTNVNSWSATI